MNNLIEILVDAVVKELKRRLREDLKMKVGRRCAKNVTNSAWVLGCAGVVPG